MKNKYTLELKEYIDNRETALVGREQGEKLLRLLKQKSIMLNSLEKEYEIIEIVVPNSIISINKSYFLGFLETRIQELGTDAFRIKYNFIASEYIIRKIDKNIDLAIFHDTQEGILGVAEND